jgi:hypothetical protein
MFAVAINQGFGVTEHANAQTHLIQLGVLAVFAVSHLAAAAISTA